MDVERTLETVSSPDVLTRLTEILSEIEHKPLSHSLHYQHIALAEQSGKVEHIPTACNTFVSCVAATDDVWLPLLDARIMETKCTGATLDAFIQVEEAFKQAERDYLWPNYRVSQPPAIPLLEAHLRFLTSNAVAACENVPQPDGFTDFYSSDIVSTRAWAVVAKAEYHLAKSHEIWDMCMEWEQSRLEQLKGQDRSDLTAKLKAAYIRRLAVPHLSLFKPPTSQYCADKIVPQGNEKTYQDYSIFVSTFLPSQTYEETLVEATAVRQTAVRLVEERDRYEASLRGGLPAYNEYIAWEAQSKKPPKHRSKTRSRNKLEDSSPDTRLVVGLYERAIAEAASQRAAALRDAAGLDSGSVRLAEAWLTTFWDGLTSFLRELPRDREIELETLQRAIRSVPASGVLAASLMRALDFHAPPMGNEASEQTLEAVSAVYNQAMESNLLDAPSITSVTIARAAYEVHRMGNDWSDLDAFERLVTVLSQGMNAARDRGGDDTLKLERFLVSVIMRLEGMSDQAIDVWEKATKFYKRRYLVWAEFASFLIKEVRDYDKARKVFKDAATPSRNLDYPQALWDAWLTFEEMHGTVEQHEYAMMRVRKMNDQLTKKIAETNRVVDDIVETAIAPSTSEVMDVDEAPKSGIDITNPNKRKAESEEESSLSKRQKADVELPPKRDRENCTVFMAGLQESTKEMDIAQLFRDCGPIREIKITKLANEVVAIIEFVNKQSTLAALTKDKKRIEGSEIAVHLAWRSTLYVTNFPENADDESIRNLFGKYGLIFDVRWPSKKFKATRRFCYVQYVSPDSAKAALELNGNELETGKPLGVYISDPQRKKERTDAGVEEREVYVAGLAKSTTQRELSDLFAQCGLIKGIRLPLDEHGKARGFAFIEFEQETSALSALMFNNREVKKRRIAVTMVDPRAPSRKEQPKSGSGKKADLISRTVRIRKLPIGSDEGLLQQLIEKVATGVRKVEIFRDVWEATVEFDSITHAAKLLLGTDQLVFQGSALELTEEPEGSKPPRGHPSASTSLAKAAFVPRAATRPKARLGLGSKYPIQPAPATQRESDATNSTQELGQAATSGDRAGSKNQDTFRAMLTGGK
ncbi:Splicing factor [Tulasnella sp. 403]|nr:Splicing factor [Tulasnella sp. 403]